MDSLIVSLYGGPGTGKTTLAADLFATLRKRRVSAHLVSEYAKEVIYRGDAHLLSDPAYQLKITREQHARNFLAVGHVQIIITDAPIMIGMAYTNDPATEQIIRGLDEDHGATPRLNILLPRVFRYEVAGRIQTEDEAAEVDTKVRRAFDQAMGRPWLLHDMTDASARIARMACSLVGVVL